jgi:hypothetical protein
MLTNLIIMASTIYIYIYLNYICICVCKCVYRVMCIQVQYLQKPKGGVKSSGARVTVSCESADMGVRNQTQILCQSS